MQKSLPAANYNQGEEVPKDQEAAHHLIPNNEIETNIKSAYNTDRVKFNEDLKHHINSPNVKPIIEKKLMKDGTLNKNNQVGWLMKFGFVKKKFHKIHECAQFFHENKISLTILKPGTGGENLACLHIQLSEQSDERSRGKVAGQ
jgi:hypothetical protein